MLFRAGALVNNTSHDLLTLCLHSQRKPPRKREFALLLFAGGEKFTQDSHYYEVEYLRLPKQNTLKYQCQVSSSREKQCQSVLQGGETRTSSSSEQVPSVRAKCQRMIIKQPRLVNYKHNRNFLLSVRLCS